MGYFLIQVYLFFVFWWSFSDPSVWSGWSGATLEMFFGMESNLVEIRGFGILLVSSIAISCDCSTILNS